MDLPETIREQAKAALVKAYLPHYDTYERFALVGKAAVKDNKMSVYHYLCTKENEQSMFLDGFIAAAEVLGISENEFREALSQYGKEPAPPEE